MYDDIDEYIRANRDQYTREAITAKLLAAGHQRTMVDAAWERADRDAGRRSAVVGWRPSWLLLLALVVVGAIGATLVWADDPYGAGIAPVVYTILAVAGIGLAKGLASLIDGGHRLPVGIVLVLLAAGGAYVGLTGGLSVVAIGVLVLIGFPALALLSDAGGARRGGWVAAIFPLLVWLVVTGTCYAPLFGRLLPP